MLLDVLASVVDMLRKYKDFCKNELAEIDKRQLPTGYQTNF
jgi:hypothetical protein